MLKSILKLKGAQTLGKNEQQSINGGSPPGSDWGPCYIKRGSTCVCVGNPSRCSTVCANKGCL